MIELSTSETKAFERSLNETNTTGGHDASGLLELCRGYDPNESRGGFRLDLTILWV
jgi:hypothetical protein